MNILINLRHFFLRRRRTAGFFLAVLAFSFVWTGFNLSDYLLPNKAVANSAHSLNKNLPDNFSSSKADMLQSAVDSMALGLGPAFYRLDDEKLAESALLDALGSLSLELGGEVYFSAFDGTKIIHAPFSPDSAGLDFSDTLDAEGRPFIVEMNALAQKGNGFLQVSLPRQLPKVQSYIFEGECSVVPVPLDNYHRVLTTASDSLEQKTKTASKTNLPVSALVATQLVATAPNIFSVQAAFYSTLPVTAASFHLPGASTGVQRIVEEKSLPAHYAHLDKSGMAVKQIVYVRRLPQSTKFIAAFMPVEQDAKRTNVMGFSSAWTSSTQAGTQKSNRMADYRRGLCVSGFSLAGLAGLMLMPGKRSKS